LTIIKSGFVFIISSVKYLKKKLFATFTPDQIEKYYKAAGIYFASQNYFEEGIHYSVLGKDIDHAVEIITQDWERMIDLSENVTLDRWIKMLPAGISDKNPTLLIIKGYLCDTFVDFESMAKYLKEASKLIDENTSSPRLLGSFASVHSALSCYTNNLPDSLSYATKALNLLSPDQGFLLDYAQNFKAFALNTLKSGAEARDFIMDIRSGLRPEDKRRLMRSHVIQIFNDWHQARLQDLKDSGQLVVEICENEKVWWFYKVGHYYLGQYHYMKNHVNEVYSFIDKGIECSFNGSPIWALHPYYTGSLAALAEKDSSKAQYYLESAKELIHLNNLSQYEGYIRAFEVEVALRTHNIELAWQLNKDAVYAIHPPFYFYYIPHFTQIKLYIQKGDDELMKEAGDLIFQFKELALATNNLYARIQIILLEGVWLSKSGQYEKAVAVIKELLALIDEPEYIRVFLDMGQPVKELLQALPEEQKQTPLARNILMAFRYEENLQSPKFESINLTPKEMELMELVASGMQNKQIADQLCLSDSTIKTYLYRIYQKLEVKNRSSAIRKIQHLQSSQ
jgi:LuxR family maltose regulon positive regulatory protein